MSGNLRYLNIRAYTCKAPPIERLSDKTFTVISFAAAVAVVILVSCLANAYVYGYLG